MKPVKLSIIIPVYNVEEYLSECLDSVFSQPMPKDTYEVIAINDGSKDGSLAILKQYEEKYDNLKVYDYENSGLGATRNKGINLASGQYITFLDSDDLIPQGAYLKLLESLEKSGSEVATGPVVRLSNGKETRSYLHKQVTYVPASKVKLEDYLDLVYDTTSTNKMYDLAFIKKHEIQFPVGIAYEDINFVYAAFLNAQSIDVIDSPVYIWRIRAGENISISQNRFNQQNFLDRLTVLYESLEMSKESGLTKFYEALRHKILVLDLELFTPKYRQTDEVFTAFYIKEVMKMLEVLAFQPEIEMKELPYRMQVVYQSVLNHDIATLLNYSEDHLWETRLRLQGNDLVKEDPFLPEEMLQRLDFTHVLPFTTRVLEVTDTSKIINIEAICLSKEVQFDGKNDVITAHLENLFGDVLALAVTYDYDKEEEQYNVKLTIPKDPLKNDQTYRVKMSLQVGDYSGRCYLGEPRGKDKMKTKLLVKASDFVYYTDYNFGWQLVIKKDPIVTILDDTKIVDDKLFIIGNFSTDPSLDYFMVQEDGQKIPGYLIEDDIVFDLATMANDDKYEFELQHNGVKSNAYRFSKIKNYFTANKSDRDSYSSYIVRKFTSHSFTVTKKSQFTSLLDIKKQGNDVTLNVELPSCLSQLEIDKVTMVFESTNGKYKYQYPVDVSQLPIITYAHQEDYFLYQATYHLFIKVYTTDGRIFVSQVLDDRRKINKENQEQTSGKREVCFESKNGHQVYMKVASKPTLGTRILGDEKRDKIYGWFKKLPIDKKVIMYDSYWSDQFACSPKAIYEAQEKLYPGMKAVWVFNDVEMPITHKGIKIKRNSLMYWYYLARAKFIVHNTNMPNPYDKRPGQKELFIPHGSFMKVMGHDTPEYKLYSDEKKALFDMRIGRWDYVAVPSDFMEEKIDSAFSFKGTVIKEGLPRNLGILEANDRKDQIKEALNIPKHHKVVMYAPTWREGRKNELKLDLDVLQKELVDTTILVRTHYLVSRSISITEYEPFAKDVSGYGDIEDLYAISDLLITDYSSVMFDYAYTGKPMLFFSYDLEKYVNSERGTYLEYEKVVPGDIVRSTEAMLPALKDIEAYQRRTQSELNEFADTYCQYGRDKESVERLLKIFLDK